MGKTVKERRFFYILTLILLAGFLVLPKICLADDFENITLTEIDKYLELPEKDANKLMDTLRQVFTTEGILLWSSGDATEEKIAVAVTLLKVVKMQALSHLLVDAPIEITWGIVKGAVEMSKIFLDPYGVSVVLDKIEKETVQRAVEYGMNFLIENEIRVTPGAIKFRYPSYKGEEREITFQYVMIYKSENDPKRAKVEIIFYMPNSIETPDAQKFGWVSSLYIPDLRKNLLPFIVKIQGMVEKNDSDNYQWINEKGEITHPSVNITFPPSVPDLGIKLLSFWEKQILKPIETTIKEVEIIITKVTGKSLGLMDIWNEIKSFISKIKSFSPAGLTESIQIGRNQLSIDETLKILTITETTKGIVEAWPQRTEETVEDSPQQTTPQQTITLEELQEILDDIAEKIDILNQQVAELVEVRLQQAPKIGEIDEAEEIEEVEEIEKLEESELAEETAQVGDIILCQKIGEPIRNKVIFNEIAWMGTDNSVNDEWIELKNISGAPIDLSGWQLLDKENQIKVIFASGKLFSVNGLLLLERTDDNSVPGVTADLIYAGILNNTDEALYLFDGNCQLQDEVLANPNWPAGDNSSKRTMERKYDLGWQTSLNPGGTPKTENSSGYYVSSGGGGGAGAPPPPTQPQPQIILSYSQNSLVNKEIEVTLSALNFLNATYDVKISIENGTTTLSEIYNENLNKWRSSSYYVTSTFSGTSFSGNFRLRIKQDENDFRGEADIFAKIRETGKTSIYLQFSGKINIIDPQENPTQNQPPLASFAFSPQTPFVGDDILFDASSSTDSDGTITSYIWDFGDTTTSTEIKATTTHNYSTSSDFLVSLTVIDNNNATGSATTTIAITAPENQTLEVVINEIQIDSIVGDGGAEDDWVELYNPTTQDISLAGWSIQEHSATSSCSIDVGFYKKNFPTGTIIPANSHFLIVDTEANENLKMIADFTIGWSLTQGNTIYLVNDEEKIESGEDSNIVDKVGFGQACFPEIEAAPNPPEGKSIERKELGLDTDDNSQDFVINENPSPTNSRSEAGPTFLTNYQISEDTTFTPQGSPYIIGNTLYVLEGKILTINSGVTLKFKENAGLEVQGTLRAIGEENKNIVFTSVLPPSGSNNWWNKIYFSPSNNNSILEYCEIDNARGEPEYAVLIVDSSFVELKNIILQNIAQEGLRLINSSTTIDGLIVKNIGATGLTIYGGEPEVKNSKFDQSSSIAPGIFIKEGSRAKIIGNYIEGSRYPQGPLVIINSYPVVKDNIGTSTNSFNGIFVFGEVTQDWKLYKNEDFPYYLYLTKTLEDTVLEFEQGVTVNISNILEINGTLKADGVENDKITISGCSSDGCYQGQLYFTPQSKNSAFKNVLIKKGHSNGAIKISGTDVDFQNTEFRDNNIGLLLENSSSAVLNCVFSDNPAISIQINGGAPIIKDSLFTTGNIAIRIEDGSQALIENNSFEHFNYPQGTIFVNNSYPICKGNSGQNNNINGIYLYGTVSNNWILYKNDIPYVIDYLEVVAGKILEIEAGTIIQLVPYPGVGRMEINGVLKAIGQENNKITFTSLSPNSKWDTLHFTSQEATSTLKYVIISNGGRSDKQKGALYLENAKLELQNILFDQNYYCLYFENSPQSVISDSKFENCYRGILIEDGCPQINNLNLNCTCNFSSPFIPCATTSASICP